MERIRVLHRPPEPDPKVMSFVEHLQELRRRLIIMVVAIAVASIIGWFLVGPVLQALEAPLKLALSHAHNPFYKLLHKQPLIQGSLFGPFTLKLKLSIIIGIVISMPILVWQVWGFVVPALPARFYRYGPYVMSAGIVLFVAGGLTGYLVMPLAIAFFVQQGGNVLTILPDAGSYISFVSLVILIFGVSFEMPLALVLLCLAGITNSGWLWRKRVVAFFVIFAVSTIITPGADWISPLVLGGILFVLYLVSIVVAKALGR